MARLRSIKPSFFMNDELSDVLPLGRLLFIGLWCIADRLGRLEDRPNRIKAETLPYDKCDVNSLLQALTDRGFLVRYEVDGARYIQIVNFAKHQKPHLKEVPSVIPAENGSVLAPTQVGASTDPGDDDPEKGDALPGCVAVDPFICDSVNPLIRDSGNCDAVIGCQPTQVGAGSSAAPQPLARFDEILQGVSGYAPSADFYATLLRLYPNADYELEAVKIAGYLQEAGKPCTVTYVLNWFSGIHKSRNGASSGKRTRPITHAEAVDDPDRFKNDPYLQELQARQREEASHASGT